MTDIGREAAIDIADERRSAKRKWRPIPNCQVSPTEQKLTPEHSSLLRPTSWNTAVDQPLNQPFNGDCGHAPEVLVALSPALVERCRHIVMTDVSATFMREGRRHRFDQATNIARSISPTIFRFDGSEKRANDFCPSSATKLVAFWPQETWNAERFQHLRELAERRHC